MMNATARGARRGVVLVVAVIAILVLTAMSAAYLMHATAQAGRSQATEGAVELLNIAEAGVAAALADLKAGNAGNVTGNFGGGNYLVTTTDEGNDYYLVRSEATLGDMGSPEGVRRVVEVEVLQATSSGTANARAAVEAAGPVTTLGTISIDGRDWAYDGASITGPGVYGVSSMDTVTRGGSSKIGGNGVAPSGASNIYEANAYWGDHVDADADGTIDEELWDGVDNDGDGKTDEDTSSYPTNPDVAIGLATGTLKAWAQSYGTYFTSEAAINQYIADNGGIIPGGKVYYLEFNNWTAVNFGDQPSTYDPSILVMHNATGTAEMKNLHGTFRGLVMSDFITHINGDAIILGGVKSFADSAIGNAYGNGNAQVRYSSAILAMLPGDPQGGDFIKQSWKEAD